jgi:hypothetical protein
VRGKLTKKSIFHAVIDSMTIMKEKVQSLHTDVMHEDSHKFLVTVVEALQLMIKVSLVNETADQLSLGLQGHLNLLYTRGFQPTIVYVDPQSGFRAVKNLFPGILMDDGGALDYVPRLKLRLNILKSYTGL